MTADDPTLEITSVEALRDWLELNYGQVPGIWLTTYKASEGNRYVSREAVLDQLLCFGWIDGRRRKLDDRRTQQWVSPRRAQHWAQTYKDRAEVLIESGEMQAPGLASIERSKAEGLWDFMADVDALMYPVDLEDAFDPQTRATFAAFPPSAQRFTLRWIKLAKTPGTRHKRIKETVTCAARGDFVPGVRMPSKS